jgi:potassium efflux system protein
MGTVSKIRIRATTILDWDNKEVIIPNKNFITERLMNWTLSDATTRKTIKVGVAYGSDVNLTEELLLKIAKDCEGVQTEPPPVALFLSFGDSSLDFELRVFIRSIREILPVTHRLHKEIDRRFKENGIEIAFPQQDIHFDDKPIEVKVINPGQPAPDSAKGT